MQFLRRGIPVLSEHPLTPSELIRCLDTAERSGTVFHVATGFGDLQIARSLVSAAGKHGPPQFALAVTALRLVYALLDLLARATGPRRLRVSGSIAGPAYQLIDARWGALPVSLAVQRAFASEDDGRDLFVGQRLSIGFPTGVLTLADLAGPLIWSPSQPSRMWRWRLVGGAQSPSASQLAVQRARANLHSLRRLAQHFRGGETPPEQARAHLAAVTAGWARICRELSPRTRSSS